MKESMWGYYLVVMGFVISIIMIFMTNLTTTNQQNYYLLKEVANAAMIDAIDYGYYRKYGEMKINAEKFVENFLRRFAEGVSKTNTYKIDFYSIYENPPSASIKVTTNTGDYNIVGTATNMDVINTIDVIMESNNSMGVSGTYYSMPWGRYENLDSDGYAYTTMKAYLNSLTYYKNVKDTFSTQLTSLGRSFVEENIEVANVKFLRIMSGESDLEEYERQKGDTYVYTCNYDDLPDLGYASSNEVLLAEEVKDVKMTVINTPGGKIITWTGKFKCDEIVDEEEGVKRYRINPIKKYGECNADNYDKYVKQYGNGIGSDLNVYSDKDEDGATDDYWIETSYYKACIPGIKYKIDFYYNNSLG